MLNIPNTNIFFNSISELCPNLSKNLIEPISLMLALIDNNNDETIKERANEYAKNIYKYIQSKSIKDCNSLELAIVAIGESNKQKIEFLKNLQLVKPVSNSETSNNNFVKRTKLVKKHNSVSV
ncbi:MAG: hypothetical protein ACK4OM_03995 [Alphaproteobacteria bacterium]